MRAFGSGGAAGVALGALRSVSTRRAFGALIALRSLLALGDVEGEVEGVSDWGDGDAGGENLKNRGGRQVF